jgi:2'-5' RNA ligase
LTEFGEHFADDNHLSGTRLKSERLHVSLHHIGDFGRLKSKFVHAARQTGNAVSQLPFEVTFRFIESFSPPPIVGRIRRRPLVLRGEGRALFELHSTLGAAKRECGLNAAGDFVPHMTLLYGSKAVPLQAIEPIRFVAREFILIHSELGLTRYTALGRCALESKATAARGAPLRGVVTGRSHPSDADRPEIPRPDRQPCQTRWAASMSRRATGSSIPRP